jgi:RNA polymerase sigma factor (sigma-70 family)
MLCPDVRRRRLSKLEEMTSTLLDRMTQEHTMLDGAQGGVAEDNDARITSLFLAHRESLERYLRARLGSTEEARELAQETYTRLIALPKCRKVSEWEALMWCTARNLANNRIERRKTRRSAIALLQIDAEDRWMPEIEWGEEQAMAVIRRAMDKLAERPRRVLTRHLEGKNFDEIARELGVTERTCRRDVVLAIVEIRREIGLGRRT